MTLEAVLAHKHTCTRVHTLIIHMFFIHSAVVSCTELLSFLVICNKSLGLGFGMFGLISNIISDTLILVLSLDNLKVTCNLNIGLTRFDNEVLDSVFGLLVFSSLDFS